MAQCLAGTISAHDNPEAQFNELALELFALQCEHNAAYRRLCVARGVSPRTVLHWQDIPTAPTSAFKELELTSVPAAERVAVFHSSGTTGQDSSRHFHSAESLALYEASLLPWFRRHLLPETGTAGEGTDAATESKLDFLILTPPASAAPHSSLVHMFETVRHELGSAASAFCGSVEADGAWSLDQARIETILRSAVREQRPVILLGTAFNYVNLLDHLSERGTSFALPPGSRALETGGYKGRSRALPKAELHALITRRLGISNIICEYGMSELSSQAYDAAAAIAYPSGLSRNFKTQKPETAPSEFMSFGFSFPPWARVQIVSPETGREVPDGEAGLIRIFDLANVWSVLAIQTEDLGVRRFVGTGTAGGFELLGRAVAAEPRGCSLMAVGNE